MKLICKVILYFLIVQLFLQNSFAQSNEYLLKAVFFEKFARFSTWPESVSADTFKICVIGDSPFEGALERVYQNHKIKNKPVSIEYISTIYELDKCHILFISSSEKEHLQLILKEISESPILTLGETAGFAKKGVIINFYETTLGTVHFEINRKEQRKSGIKMDVMLLDFAKLIE